MSIGSKPIERLLMETATASGCTDENALAQALDTAANNGGHFVDSLLDAEVLPDEAAFFQKLGASLRLPFAAPPRKEASAMRQASERTPLRPAAPRHRAASRRNDLRYSRRCRALGRAHFRPCSRSPSPFPSAAARSAWTRCSWLRPGFLAARHCRRGNHDRFGRNGIRSRFASLLAAP